MSFERLLLWIESRSGGIEILPGAFAQIAID
jgi:hypothetical protein